VTFNKPTTPSGFKGESTQPGLQGAQLVYTVYSRPPDTDSSHNVAGARDGSGEGALPQLQHGREGGALQPRGRRRCRSQAAERGARQEAAGKPAQGLDQDPEEVAVRPPLQRLPQRRREARPRQGGRPHRAPGVQLVHQRAAADPARDHPEGGQRPGPLHHQQAQQPGHQGRPRPAPPRQAGGGALRGGGGAGPRVCGEHHHVPGRHRQLRRRGVRGVRPRDAGLRRGGAAGGGGAAGRPPAQAEVRQRGERRVQHQLRPPAGQRAGQPRPLLPLHPLLLHHQEAVGGGRHALLLPQCGGQAPGHVQDQLHLPDEGEGGCGGRAAVRLPPRPLPRALPAGGHRPGPPGTARQGLGRGRAAERRTYK